MGKSERGFPGAERNERKVGAVWLTQQRVRHCGRDAAASRLHMSRGSSAGNELVGCVDLR